MSLVGREFNITRNFGPYILRSTISDELHKILLDTANKIRKNKKLKKDNDYRKALAGNLTEEYSYANAFTTKEDKIVDEEKVPVIIPITKTKAKSLMIPAPNIHKENAASNVVKLVMIDLDNTRLIAISIIFLKLVTGFSSSSSLIRSKTTMVSLIE